MPTVKCENCGKVVEGNALYDEHFETYFCDRQCFSEHFAENDMYETYYYRLNVYEGTIQSEV